MPASYDLILDAVRETRQSWRLHRVAEGVLLTAGATLAALVVAAVTDQVLDPGHGGRWVLWLIVAGVCVAFVRRRIIPPLTTRHSDDYFAALIEQRASLANRFINALQLGRGPQAATAGLIGAIVEDAVAAMNDFEPRRVVRSPLLGRAAAGLTGVVLLAVLYAVTSGGAMTSAARVLLPWASIQPFTWTRVALIEPAQARVRLLEGEPLTLSARITGRPAEPVLARWTGAAGSAPRLPMTREQGDLHTLTLERVAQSGELFVEAGDGRSRAVHIEVVPRPRVVELQARITPPEYTGRTPHEAERFDGHLLALPGSEARITLVASKALASASLIVDGSAVSCDTEGSDTRWTATLPIDGAATYRIQMTDTQGYEVTEPTTWTITALRDAPPTAAVLKPGRDVQLHPGQALTVEASAHDDIGVAELGLWTRHVRDDAVPQRLTAWPQAARGQQRVVQSHTLAVDALGLQPGDRLEYWAAARDHHPDDAAREATSRRYVIHVVSPQAADQMIALQLTDYARIIGELIKAQRQNRADTADLKPPAGLIDRQVTIRAQTLRLAELMQRNAFPARSMINELSALAGGPMARIVTGLEGYRDADTLDLRQTRTQATLPMQDEVIASLEDILQRLNRGEQVRQTLKKLERTEPVAHGKTLAVAAKLGADLDSFLTEMKSLDDEFDKMAKRRDDDIVGDDLEQLKAVEHRLDKWGQWAKDTVDEILKLPEGFVKDSALAENVSTIFEEIEKKQRAAQREIATPVEEGAKVLATEVAEDLEMWMPDAGDNIKWTMEDPVEGRFEVPETKLPDSLQDMVGDLIEDVEEFDEEADDITGGWGGNMQVGWDIADGPISSFAALGKTGNQMPNASEMGGRSGAGRRGRSSGQMVGAESSGLEGRPTPARLTQEPYEPGQVDASKQLDPSGATGGGRKTGGGTRGLQGGTPPDFVKDMQRLAEKQKLLREESQKIARQLDYAGRPSQRIEEAAARMSDAEAALRDLRYDDAARLRKESIHELRAAASQIDQGVTLNLQKARDLPPDLREQIISGSRQALPEGYEEMVGEYFKAVAGGE